MAIYLGNTRMEIKDAIRQLKRNITWLKGRVLVASKAANTTHFVLFYTQKIQRQEALLDYLSQHQSTSLTKHPQIAAA